MRSQAQIFKPLSPHARDGCFACRATESDLVQKFGLHAEGASAEPANFLRRFLLWCACAWDLHPVSRADLLSGLAAFMSGPSLQTGQRCIWPSLHHANDIDSDIAMSLRTVTT